MQEYSSTSTVQDYGSLPTETSVCMDGASRLLRLGRLAQELGAEPVAEEARELAARVSEGRFYVACIGQFKRGKSTLLNALVGHAVVPTGFVPVTAVPTVIRYGDEPRARVRMRDGAWRDVDLTDLKEYVTEELNPENKKAVDGAEVFVPSPLLSSGMCFVDTPGLGSVFTGNTATTQAFIPHIDAALVVVGADPPIAGEELALVEEVGKQVQDLILVINKADRTTDPERAAAVKFTREILEKRLHRPMGEVLEVSAAERMENSGPLRDWERLLASLHHLVEDSGTNLVRAACHRGLQRLSEQLLAIISEDRDALQRPIEESERRIELMRETINEAERSMHELDYLFMAELHRISDLFGERHKRFFQSAWTESETEFSEELPSVPLGFGPHYRRRVMHLAQEISRRNVVPWLKPEQEEGERQYRAVALRFVEMGNNFLKKLASAGLGELTRMPHALDPEKGLRVRSTFIFEDFIGTAQPPSPLRWLADIFLPLVAGRKLIANDAREFLRHLLEVNSSRVQNDVLNRIQDSRAHLEAEIRKLLHEISRVAEQALDRARKVKEEGFPAVQSAVERLNRIERDVSDSANPVHAEFQAGESTSIGRHCRGLRGSSVIAYSTHCWTEIDTKTDLCPHCGTGQGADPRSYEEKLVAALAHPLPEARARICWLIGENRIHAAVPCLMHMAEHDPDLFVQKAGVEALGLLRDSRSIALLDAMSGSANRFLADAAKKSSIAPRSPDLPEWGESGSMQDSTVRRKT